MPICTGFGLLERLACQDKIYELIRRSSRGGRRLCAAITNFSRHPNSQSQHARQHVGFDLHSIESYLRSVWQPTDIRIFEAVIPPKKSPRRRIEWPRLRPGAARLMTTALIDIIRRATIAQEDKAEAEHEGEALSEAEQRLHGSEALSS